MLKLNILIVLCVINIILCDTLMKDCNTTSYPSTCPVNSICSQQNQTSTVDGICNCNDNNLIFNTNYTNDSDYCIASNKSHDNAVNVIDVTENNSAASRQIPPSTHHIVGGILIPILLVFFFFGIAITMKRLNVIQRIRNIRRTRRNRPLYEDVMMGNDADDPPLI